MKVFYGLEDLPAFRQPVLTIGTFDGVHLGHQAILKRLHHRAIEIGGESVLITFDPHPRSVLQPGRPVSLLHTLPEKIAALEELGIDVLVVVPFTLAFSELSAEAYIRDFLVNHFHPHTIIIGYDHQFGKNRSGDFTLFEKLKSVYGFQLEEIPMQELEDSAISSTRIRKAILAGDVRTAAEFLGKPYSFRGVVVQGEQLGRKMGFPTANLQVQEPQKLLPARGVYAVRVKVDDVWYQGMMNIGRRPTVSEETALKPEVHLFELDLNLYGKTLEVICVDKLREEEKFPSLEALTQQLTQDREQALNLLGSK